MDQELKEYLQAMEGRMDAKLDGLGSRMDAKLEGLESKIDAKLDCLEIRVKDHVEIVETRLLTEFWKWARTSDIKGRQSSNDIGTLTERMNAVEERLRDIEFRRPV